MKTIYVLKLFVPLLMLCTVTVYGEGTKEVMPDSTQGTGLIVSTSTSFPLGNVGSYLPASGPTPVDQRIYFRIKDYTKETLNYGFNWETLAPSGTISTYNDVYMNIYDPSGVLVTTIKLPTSGAGFIPYWKQAFNGTKVAGLGTGYDPLTFTPTMNGDYYVNFFRGSSPTNHSIQESMLAKYFDMTVVNVTGLTRYTGRIHCNEWAFSVYNPKKSDIQDPLSSTNAQFYTYSTDSVIAKVYFPSKGFEPLSYIVAFNSFGVINTNNWVQDRKSIVLTKLDTLHLRNGYPVFLNSPDTTIWKPSPLPKVPQLVNPTISGCAPGPFNLRFKAPQAGDYYVLLDLNGVAGYQANTADRWIELVSQQPGVITYVWDGKNGLGVSVPANTSFPITFSFRKGRINIPFYDVEMNVNGFSVDGVIPQKSLNRILYWDDTQLYNVTNDPLANNYNTTGSGIDNSIMGQMSPGHAWSGNGNPSMLIPAPSVSGNDTDNDQTNDYGNARLINTWAWGVVLDTTQNVTLTCVSVSGHVWDDADNSANGTFTNIRTNSEPGVNVNNTLYASLVDPITGKVVGTAQVDNTGFYQIYNVPTNSTDWQIVLSTVNGVVGGNPPTGNAPSGWLNTSPLIHTFSAGNSDVTGIDFGIEQLPNSNDQSYTIAMPAINSFLTLNGFGTGTGSSPGPLFGSDPEDGSLGSGKKVTITKVPTNEELYYNNVKLTDNYTITNYNPALLQVKFTTQAISLSFQYAYIDAAGKQDPSPATYTINMSAVLATSFGPFTGRAGEEGNVLSWQAFNEGNGNYFTIDRSTDGIAYAPVGRVDGNSGGGNGQHTFTDLHPVAGATNYYRLQLSDNTGGASYSNVVTIINSPVSSIVEIAPNPFTDAIGIRVNCINTERIIIRLLDSRGAVLKKSEYMGQKGANSISLNGLQSLPVSIYFVQVVFSDQVFTRKVFNR